MSASQKYIVFNERTHLPTFVKIIKLITRQACFGDVFIEFVIHNKQLEIYIHSPTNDLRVGSVLGLLQTRIPSNNVDVCAIMRMQNMDAFVKLLPADTDEIYIQHDMIHARSDTTMLSFRLHECESERPGDYNKGCEVQRVEVQTDMLLAAMSQLHFEPENVFVLDSSGIGKVLDGKLVGVVRTPHLKHIKKQFALRYEFLQLLCSKFPGVVTFVVDKHVDDAGSDDFVVLLDFGTFTLIQILVGFDTKYPVKTFTVGKKSL